MLYLAVLPTEDQVKVVADAAANQTWQITADKDAATIW